MIGPRAPADDAPPRGERADLPTAAELLEDVRALDRLLEGADVGAARERLRALCEGGAIRATPHGARYVLEADLLPAVIVAGAARSDHRIAGARLAHLRARAVVPAASSRAA